MSYLDGNQFKQACYHQYDEGGLHINDEGQVNYIFVKTDLLYDFFSQHSIDFEFTLVTHNSDLPINREHLQILSLPNLQKWYAQNVDIEHPKLQPIPIGLANDQWSHGNKKIFKEVSDLELSKDILCYANFDTSTNPEQRNWCLVNTKQEWVYPKTDFKNYLTQVKRCMFVISPEGNGIDCHKTWEALYLNAIPIVKKSISTCKFKKLGLPLLLINDWKELLSLQLTTDLYKKAIQESSFKPEQLNLNYFIRE